VGNVTLRSSEPAFLNETQRSQILERHQALVAEGKLPPTQQLPNEYALFRERFGPSVLAGWDGEALLAYMHDHGNKDIRNAKGITVIVRYPRNKVWAC